MVREVKKLEGEIRCWLISNKHYLHCDGLAKHGAIARHKTIPYFVRKTFYQYANN